jgi:hypothetical protein
MADDPMFQAVLKRWTRTSAFRRLAHYTAALLIYFAAGRHGKDIFALLPAGILPCRYILFHMFVFGGWVAVLTYRNLSWLRSRRDPIPSYLHPFLILLTMLLVPFLFYPVAFLVAWRMTDQIEHEASENDRPAPPPLPVEIPIPDIYPGDK